jgi:membrane protein implicated in regulation of membrane protease activity
MSLFISNGASYCSEIADTPMTVYRPVWKTVLTTIDGTSTTTIELDLTQSSPGNTTVIERATKIDKGVAVMWRATDLPDFPEDYASLLAKRFDIEYTPSGASTTSSNSVSSATPEAQSRTPASLASPTSTPSAFFSPTPTPSLSSGAKAGLGIGVALLVLLSILGALFIAKRRRKAKQKQHSIPELHAEEQKNMAELSDKDEVQCAGVVVAGHELDGKTGAHELDGKTWKAELDGTSTSPVYELKGDDVERR